MNNNIDLGATIRERHDDKYQKRFDAEAEPKVCTFCDVEWPCDAIRLLDRLEQVSAENARLREAFEHVRDARHFLEWKADTRPTMDALNAALALIDSVPERDIPASEGVERDGT